PSAVKDLVSTSRALVLSSRWESGPIVAFEALCLGASLVGPEWVPSVRGFCGEGPFGTLFQRQSPTALSAAIVEEMTAWKQGARKPQATAMRFRPRFSSRTVCQAFLPEANATAPTTAIRGQDESLDTAAFGRESAC